jgi:hypothetical protein
LHAGVKVIDQKVIWNNHPKSGIVDFVTNWFLLASKYISKHGCQSAFVATSSIAQGEQPFILWSELNKFNVHISYILIYIKISKKMMRVKQNAKKV